MDPEPNPGPDEAIRSLETALHRCTSNPVCQDEHRTQTDIDEFGQRPGSEVPLPFLVTPPTWGMCEAEGAVNGSDPVREQVEPGGTRPIFCRCLTLLRNFLQSGCEHAIGAVGHPQPPSVGTGW